MNKCISCGNFDGNMHLLPGHHPPSVCKRTFPWKSKSPGSIACEHHTSGGSSRASLDGFLHGLKKQNESITESIKSMLPPGAWERIQARAKEERLEKERLENERKAMEAADAKRKWMEERPTRIKRRIFLVFKLAIIVSVIFFFYWHFNAVVNLLDGMGVDHVFGVPEKISMSMILSSPLLIFIVMPIFAFFEDINLRHIICFSIGIIGILVGTWLFYQYFGWDIDLARHYFATWIVRNNQLIEGVECVNDISTRY